MSTYKIIQGLVNDLFEADKRRLNQTINKLCARNKQLKRGNVDGFHYAGKRYLPDTGTLIVAANQEGWLPLDKSLVPEMLAHLRDAKTVENEKTVISQMLFRLIKPCKTPNELRDALPECLVDCVPSLKAYSRSRKPAYTLEGDERGIRQFEKLLPKMEAYSVAKMLY